MLHHFLQARRTEEKEENVGTSNPIHKYFMCVMVTNKDALVCDGATLSHSVAELWYLYSDFLHSSFFPFTFTGFS